MKKQSSTKPLKSSHCTVLSSQLAGKLCKTSSQQICDQGQEHFLFKQTVFGQ